MATFYDKQDESEGLKALKEALRRLEALNEKSRTVERLQQKLTDAVEAQRLRQGLRRQFADIFRDGEVAYDHFMKRAQKEGIEAAIAFFKENPEGVSELKGWSLGPLNSNARQGILKLSLPRALQHGARTYAMHQKAGGGVFDKKNMQDRIDTLEKEMEFSHKSLGSSGERIDFETNVAWAARNVTYAERVKLPPDQQRQVEGLVIKCQPLVAKRMAMEEQRKKDEDSRERLAAREREEAQEAQEEDQHEDQQKGPQAGQEDPQKSPAGVSPQTSSSSSSSSGQGINVDPDEEFDL